MTLLLPGLIHFTTTRESVFSPNIYKLSRKWPSSDKSFSSRQMSSQYPWIIKIVIKISPSGIFLKETPAITPCWRNVRCEGKYLFDICEVWGQWGLLAAGVENVSVPLMRQTGGPRRDQGAHRESTQHKSGHSKWNPRESHKPVRQTRFILQQSNNT